MSPSACLNSTLGVKTLLFRPPYGIDHQPETADEVAQAADRAIHGLHDRRRAKSIRTIGAKPRRRLRRRRDVIVQRVLEQARMANGGNIVLMHDGGGDRSQTVAALPKIIDGLRAQGFRDLFLFRICSVRRARK